ncbi:hypothetical protein [Candidatus Nitrosocosmicus franklandus]|uniref:Uncharacterized protein n=1 Tax=Candidatus Nitrosocosmicus franklandianus TaxID=1798806 RepID=A0A484I7J4_9ARCH|nr:hypothetical protein [Candidatus Nitrosocosmicus franklandus]VFJ12720.1 protein of unknown function [Candidatus Nitrosocosmicus franklandus]
MVDDSLTNLDESGIFKTANLLNAKKSSHEIPLSIDLNSNGPTAIFD